MLVSGLMRQSVRARLRHEQLLRRHMLTLEKLFERVRRDADAKAMLLRELNHRVKNNLTSIITLLSLEEPELPPAPGNGWTGRSIASGPSPAPTTYSAGAWTACRWRS